MRLDLLGSSAGARSRHAGTPTTPLGFGACTVAVVAGAVLAPLRCRGQQVVVLVLR
jgi:hypothetical protein